MFSYTSDDSPLPDPYTSLDALPEGRPYHVVGEGDVHVGLRIFDGMVSDAYRGGYIDSNALVVTHGGTMEPTIRYPTSVTPGFVSPSGDTLLVDLTGLMDFDAPAAADHLTAVGVLFSVHGVTVESPK